MVPDSDSFDDILFPPATTDEPTLGKFRPKPRPKTVKPTVAPKRSSSTLKPLRADESKSLEKEQIIPAAEENTNQRSSEQDADRFAGIESIGDHIQPRLSNVSVVNSVPGGGESIGTSTSTSPTLDASSSNFHGMRGLAHATEEPVVIASQNGARDSKSDAKLQADLNKSIAGAATALHGVEYFDDTLSHPSATSDPVLVHAPDAKCPDKDFGLPASGTMEPFETSNLCSRTSAPLGISSQLNVTQEPFVVTEELSIHEDGEAPKCGAQLSESDLPAYPDKPEKVTERLPDMDYFDDIFTQKVATSAVKQVGKFKPKLVLRPKDRKAKSVSFTLPPPPADAVVSAASEIVSHSVESHSEVLARDSTEADPSFLEMMGDALLDKNTQSYIVSDCNANFHTGHERSEKEDTAQCSGFELLDNSFSQPNVTTDRVRGKFRPKPSAKTKNINPSDSSFSQCVGQSQFSQWNSCSLETESLEACLIEMSDHVAASPGSSEGLQATERTSDNYIGEKRNSPVRDTGNGVQFENVEELAKKLPGEMPAPKTVEDDEASKSSRKLRKRIDVYKSSGDADGITCENCDVEDPNISPAYIDHSDDEYRGEDMPKQKRARKKTEKNAENQRTVRRRKKASEDADSTVQPPTTKNKFSHTTQRRRRQVNKNLLETPESEIDPRLLSMKDLIRLAEAKEQILNKEAATLKKSSASQSDTHPDKESHVGEDEYSNRDGVDGDHDIQEKPPKLNYHSYMNRPQSGRWSKTETELFYQALREFGPDFSIIQEIRFPNRTRDQLHHKYKNEERKHPLQVADAIVHRPKDIEHLRLAVQLLHARRRENANGNTSAMLDDLPDGNEDGGGEHDEKEDQEASNGGEGEAQSPVKDSEWDGDGHSPGTYTGFESGYEWDHDEMNKEIYYE